MPRRKTYEEVKELFENNGYILLEDKYINNKKHMKYICKKHHDEVQKIRVDSLTRGSGCKYCGREIVSRKRRLDFDLVKETFIKRGYDLLETEYKNNRQLLEYRCLKHSDEIQKITYSDLQQGHGCSYCGGTKKLSYNEVKNIFNSNNYTLLEQKYEYSMTPMKCYCNYHPDKIQYISAHRLKRGDPCPYCTGKRATEKYNLSVEFSDVAKEWNYSLNRKNPTDYLPYSNKEVWWICNNCAHEWKVSISSRTHKNSGCPICNESKGEKIIRRWLESHNVDFEAQKEFDGLIGTGGGMLSYDFYLPDHNLLIEYQGEFHDGKRNKYVKENLEKQQEHDKRKKEYAVRNEIKLLEIWYWDFDNIEMILEKELSKLATHLIQ